MQRALSCPGAIGDLHVVWSATQSQGPCIFPLLPKTAPVRCPEYKDGVMHHRCAHSSGIFPHLRRSILRERTLATLPTGRPHGQARRRAHTLYSARRVTQGADGRFWQSLKSAAGGGRPGMGTFSGTHPEYLYPVPLNQARGFVLGTPGTNRELELRPSGFRPHASFHQK
ncbi:hypothetical protein PYCCODRAFT_1284577 [Trametes coccinea BRFM310]|uniref:Uncharacterized protein n=1 Tax=Trametes coccinea (strain BRFM310) TaxID=1353009 RepID=A0A1Y2IVE8_TRAC3|nr:hypothetical protein PYCCODRAFT_1284577 [Trametes coccinea BRFM310]